MQRFSTWLNMSSDNSSNSRNINKEYFYRSRVCEAIINAQRPPHKFPDCRTQICSSLFTHRLVPPQKRREFTHCIFECYSHTPLISADHRISGLDSPQDETEWIVLTPHRWCHGCAQPYRHLEKPRGGGGWFRPLGLKVENHFWVSLI